MPQRREDFSIKKVAGTVAAAGKKAGGAVASTGKTAGGAVASTAKTAGGAVGRAAKGIGGVFGGFFKLLLRLLKNIRLIASSACCCLLLVYLGPVVLPLVRGMWTAARLGRAAAAGVAASMAVAAPAPMPLAAAPAIAYVAANYGPAMGAAAADAVGRPISYVGRV